MGYTDKTEFPDGIAQNGLGSPRVIFEAGTTVRIAYVQLVNITASPFTATLDALGPTVATAVVPAHSTINIPGFLTTNGLRVTSSGATNSHGVSVAYYTD